MSPTPGGAGDALVLASRSPRRAALLTQAGILFEVGPAADLDESAPAGLAPGEVAEHLAREKARVVALHLPGRRVLGADTVVALGRRLLGKPADAREACFLLSELAGREHDVFTGVALACGRHVVSAVAQARVRMDALTPEAIRAYVATGEPLDKAGAYGIQGGAAAFAHLVAGSLDTVVGLPLELVQLLERTYPPSR